MTHIKLTKNELRDQQYKLGQLTKYLPTLQLKKTMLQIEVNQAENAIKQLKVQYSQNSNKARNFCKLLTDRALHQFYSSLHVDRIETFSENIAGIEIPVFEKIHFAKADYFFLNTPLWWDSAIEILRNLIITEHQIQIAGKRKDILAEELREVSIRVNLFEKILIPRTQANIKKIKIFLGDQQLAAVSQAKVAKEKIRSRKEKEFASYDS